MPFDSALHRAAVLIKCLPQRQASRLVLQLESAELQALYTRMRSVLEVPVADCVVAMKQFMAGTISENGTGEHKTISSASHRSRFDTRLRGPFGFLLEASNSIRFQLVRNEHPRNVAVVLSFLPTDSASRLLRQFEANERVAILRRLCQIEKFEIPAVAELSKRLHEKLYKLIQAENFNRTGVDVASKLMSVVDSETRTVVLDALGQENQELGAAVQEHLLRFENIADLSDKEIKLVLDEVDTALWAPALVTASQTLKRKVLSNFNERPRSILKREIASIHLPDPGVVENAQLQIMLIVMKLHETDAIRLTNGANKDNGRINDESNSKRAA